MATITNDWSDNENFAGSNAVSTLDNRIRTESQDVRERMQNGGHKWTNGTKTNQEGIHKVSSSNYVSGEFSVYDSAETTKLLTLTDTAAAINKPTTITGNTTVTGDLAVSGSLTVGGSPVSTTDTYCLSAQSSGGELIRFVVPVASTLTDYMVGRSDTTGTGSAVLKYYASPTWTSDRITALNSSTTLATLTVSGTNYALRSTGRSDSVVAGGVLEVSFTGLFASSIPTVTIKLTRTA